jgi:hypothetical protein
MNTTELFKKIKALNNFNVEIWNNLKVYLSGEKKSFGVKTFVVKKNRIILETDNQEQN